MVVRVVAIGPKHDPDLKGKLEDYQKRLKPGVDVQWQLLPYSRQDGDTARRAESASVLNKLKDNDLVVLLDERGTQLSSESLAAKMTVWLGGQRNLVLVIGGAYGVDDSLRQRADFTWSLSKLVFPHQLVRLMLVEQLYRSQAIIGGHPYHHQ